MPLKNSASEKLAVQFANMQKNLFSVLQYNSSKFSFAMDGWTAKNGRSYYGITVHFIDEKWCLQSVALDLAASCGNHTGEDIAKLLYEAIKTYDLEKKIQGITLDNVSANTTFIHELAKILKSENIDFDEENQHFRCFAHILNLGVQDVLKLIKIERDENTQLIVSDDEEDVEDEVEECSEYNENEDEERSVISQSLEKVRLVCKKLHYSEKLTNNLKLCCASANIEFKKVILDVKTRWNSTHDMLDVFLKLKKGFIIMFDMNSEVKKFKLEEDEWLLLEEIHKFLNQFKYVSKVLSSENKCTLPEVVVLFNLLIDRIEITTFDLDKKADRSKNDEVLISAFQAGRDKLLKHYNKCNWIYCVSLILDPRHKIVAFDKSTWGKEMKNKSIKIFKDIYCKKYCPVQQEIEMPVKKPRVESQYLLDVNSIYDEEDVSCNEYGKELDEYLKAPRASKDTDILGWWRKHESVYPSLALMARDVLSTLASSVPIERFFSIGSLTMTAKRSRLNDKTLKSLMCINSWSRSQLRQKICEI